MGRRMLGVCFVDVEEEYSREKKWQIQKPWCRVNLLKEQQRPAGMEKMNEARISEGEKTESSGYSKPVDHFRDFKFHENDWPKG
jgi:hypothetical protein